MNPSPIAHVQRAALGRAKILAFAGALSFVVVPSVARAQAPSTDVSHAESYAADAFEAYQKKDYQEAVVLYLKALEAAPSADILFNLAKIYDTKLNDRQLAMSFYRRYIADPGAEPERVRTANTRLAELRELEAAASEKPVVVSPPAPGGGDRAAPPDARRASSADRGTLPPPEEHHGLTGVQWAGIVTGVVGLGGIGVGTAFGLSAKSDADIAKQVCKGNECSTQRGVDAAKDASTSANVSTVAFIAGGALTAAGLILLLTGGASSAPSDSHAAHFTVTPYAGPGSLGTQVSGRF